MTAPEIIDICPYDSSHQVSRSRMPFHLKRCKQNYPNIRLKICPYDGRHLLNPKDYDAHVATCPAKEFTEFQNENDNHDSPGILPIQPFTTPPNDNLGDEDDSPSPLQIIQETNLQRPQFAAPLIGVSRNRRQKHRREQRRLAQGQEENVTKNEQTSTTAKNTNNCHSDSNKNLPIAKPTPKESDPPGVAEVEEKTSNLAIKSDKNTTECTNQNSARKVVAFSYAAALSGNNKPSTNGN